MIELKGLTKKYGEFCAVSDLNLKIETGEFFGLLGENGAGKTTTIGMMSTLLLPTAGEILIDGEKLDRNNMALKRQISVVTQEYSMRQDMTVDEIMEYQARLYRLPLKAARAKSEDLLDFCGLLDYKKRIVRRLSGGMKRKLMVCRALLTEPRILLLDEPTAGMDAFGRRQMWNLLRKLNSMDLTILLTTHYMEEAENLCDRVSFMKKGKLQITEKPEVMIKNLGEYAVDTIGEEGLKSVFFKKKDEALSYVASCDEKTTLRNSTLEDVFIESDKWE